MSRILSLLSHDENRRLLGEWVVENTDHDSVSPDGEAPLAGSFDLCIVDGTALREYAGEIEAAKAAAQPVFLPVLLLISRRDAFRMSADVWEYADGVTFQQLDESIATPIATFELQGRIRSLLSMRETTAELARSNERYRSLTEGVLDASEVATFVIDDEFTVAWLNRAASEYFGLEREAVIGRKKKQLITDEIAECLERPDRFVGTVTAAYDDNTYVEEFECHVLSGPNRKDRWLTHWSQPITTGQYDGGRVEHYYDVTPRKERERLLNRYKQILDNTNDLAVLLDSQGEFVFVNRKIAELTGLSVSEIEDGDVSVFVESGVISETAAERIRTSITRVLAGELPEDRTEFTVRVDGGRDIIAEFRLTPLVEDGTVVGGVSIGREITDRKRRERELRRFKEAIDQAASAIYFTDSDGRIEYVNPQFEELTGYSKGEVVGGTPAVLQSGAQSADYYDEMWETITGGDVWTESIVNRQKSGRRYTALQTIAPIPGEAGGIEGYVAVQTDITDQQRSHERLAVLQRVLRHNLRNDLMVVRGRASLIQEAADDTEISDSIQAIMETVDGLLALSEKVRSVQSRLRDIEREDATRTMEVQALLRSVQADLAERFPYASITVEGPGQPASVAKVCGEILLELGENAIRHNDRASPEVTIEATVSGEDCEVRVLDNGPGIPDIERVALDATTETPLRHSSGIGLWMVKWTVEKIGGTITITDRDPDGSVITLYLPRE